MSRLYIRHFKTPWGNFCLSATVKGLYSLDLVRDLKCHPASLKRRAPSKILTSLKRTEEAIRVYLTGEAADFSGFALDWTGVRPFEKKVLRNLQLVPWGTTRTYKFLARQAGRPQATRYVGRILGENRLPLILPCHRIVPKKGGCGGFSKGVRLKRHLLKLEKAGVDKK